MEDRSNAWLTEHLPGGMNRSVHSVAGHFADMRLNGRLPRRWRARNWVTAQEPSWTLDEDVEIMRWHVGDRRRILPEVFIANDRPGCGVIERADYLCEDEDLVEEAKAIEEDIRKAQLAYDGASTPSRDDPNRASSPSSEDLGGDPRPSREDLADALEKAQEEGEEQLRKAIDESLKSR
jgi:hypothetical protein